jgi:hypothetical protein
MIVANASFSWCCGSAKTSFSRLGYVARKRKLILSISRPSSTVCSASQPLSTDKTAGKVSPPAVTILGGGAAGLVRDGAMWNNSAARHDVYVRTDELVNFVRMINARL